MTGQAAVRPAPPIWLLVLITISGTLGMHMFVPALPYAARDLGASIGAMQMTISLYIVGLAAGQLFYGPLSDALGRRPMLMAGLAVYAVAGLAAALAPGLDSLLAARLVQALGGCAGLALGRAIVRDTAQSDKAVRQLALMNLMMMIGPGLAPIVGGAISAALGWRAVFWVLAALGASVLVFAWRLLPETGSPRGSFSVRILIQDYKSLLGSPKFAGFALGGGCTTTSIYGFIATAPFIFATQLHRPLHEVGLYLGFLIFGMSLGNILTSRLIRKVSMARLLLTGNALCMVGAVTLLVTILLERLSLGSTLFLMFLFTCGAGMASPIALTKSVSVYPKLVGSAAGLYGFTQMAVGAACTSFVALGHNPALSAATVLTVSAVLGQFGFLVALGRERAERLDAGMPA
jgi:DHA1 family bicyclomycin/chloramphenicol resistance-like MFS transporter